MSNIPRILNIYQVKKQGRASIREGASIRINTVLLLYRYTAIRTNTSFFTVFGEQFLAKTRFCYMFGHEMKVLDVNCDKYDDLVCHGPKGTIEISESHIVSKRTLFFYPLYKEDFQRAYYSLLWF